MGFTAPSELAIESPLQPFHVSGARAIAGVLRRFIRQHSISRPPAGHASYDGTGNLTEVTSQADLGADGTIDSSSLQRRTDDGAGQLVSTLVEVDADVGTPIDGIIDSIQSARSTYEAAGNLVQQETTISLNPPTGCLRCPW